MRLDGPPLRKAGRLIASHLAPLIETKPDYVRVFINERRYLPDASRRRDRRKSRRIERFFEQVIQAGIDDGSIRAGRRSRGSPCWPMLGMCNAVINWRKAESRASDIGGEFAQRLCRGLVAKGSRCSPADVSSAIAL